MAYNEQLTKRVREALADVPKTEEKKMFGGVAFMVDEKMCVTVGDDEIMCRIDPEIHDEVVTRKGCSTMVMKGREYKGYVVISEEGYKKQSDFEYFIGLALEFNKRAKAAKKTKKK